MHFTHHGTIVCHALLTCCQYVTFWLHLWSNRVQWNIWRADGFEAALVSVLAKSSNLVGQLASCTEVIFNALKCGIGEAESTFMSRHWDWKIKQKEHTDFLSSKCPVFAFIITSGLFILLSEIICLQEKTWHMGFFCEGLSLMRLW